MISRFSDNIFKRYLFSYLSILLIPIIIFSTIIFSKFIKSSEQAVLLNNTNVLYRIQKAIDTQILQLDTTAYQLYHNSEIRAFMFEEEPEKALKVSKELLRYNVVNQFVDEIFLYFRGDNFIYASAGSMSLDIFFNSMYKYCIWDTTDFENSLKESKQPFFRPSEEIMIYKYPTSQAAGKFITYVYPLPSNFTRPIATILFLIPEKSIQDLISETAKTYNMMTIIVDRQNNVLSQVGTTGLSDNSEMLKIVLDKPGSFSDSISVNNTDFLVSKVVSPKSGFKYITLTPSLQAMNSVNALKKSLMFGIAIILILGFIIISYFMKINYNPIKLLKLFSEEKLRGKSSLNEIDTIYLTLERLSEDNSHLDNQLFKNKLIIKELLLKALLKGEIHNAVMFHKIGSNFGLAKPYPYCLAAVLHIPGYSDLPDTKSYEILQNIEGFLNNNTVGFACNNMQKDQVSLILLTSHNNPDDILDNFSELMQSLKQKYTKNLVFCIGNIYDNIAKVNNSWYEAYITLDYCLATGNHHIFRYLCVCNSIEQTDYDFFSLLHNLEQSIEFDNSDIVLCNVLKITEYTDKQLKKAYLGKLLAYKLTLIQQRELKRYAPLDTEDVLLDALVLTELHTIESLKNYISNKFEQLVTHYKEKPVSNQLISEVTAYIKNEYTNFDFSVKAIADSFDMSLASLSQYFREHTGITISQYITDLKLIKAKELLSSSNKSLKEVIKEIGYYDTSSFIRKFRKNFGMTPKEYRNQFSSGQIEND